MNNSDNKNPRKTHETNTQLEEKNLWDLEDDWDDDATEKDHSANDSTEAIEETTPATAAEPTLEKTPNNKEEEEDITTEETTTDDLAEPDLAETDLTETDELELEPETEPTADEQGSTDEKTTQPDVSPLKKISLSITEKITLSALAAILIGLAIWGYSFLYKKNFLETADAFEFPVKGEYATINKFSTSWMSAGKSAGVKFGVTMVPAARITLDEASTSGALRIFFRNSEKDRVGDPVTISFQDGKFNDPNKPYITLSDSGATANISASDGFAIEGDFHAYQMDDSLAWKVHVLEADNANAAGSSYKELFNTKVEARRQ